MTYVLLETCNFTNFEVHKVKEDVSFFKTWMLQFKEWNYPLKFYPSDDILKTTEDREKSFGTNALQGSTSSLTFTLNIIEIIFYETKTSVKTD